MSESATGAWSVRRLCTGVMRSLRITPNLSLAHVESRRARKARNPA
jgi:hypothetical protein